MVGLYTYFSQGRRNDERARRADRFQGALLPIIDLRFLVGPWTFVRVGDQAVLLGSLHDISNMHNKILRRLNSKKLSHMIRI